MKNEWQPIETAPKDRYISIKGKNGPYGVNYWEAVAIWGIPRNWSRERGSWQTRDGAVLYLAGYVPTHWMPLPDPPEDGRETVPVMRDEE